MMFRIWSEHLPLDVAASQDVQALLMRGALHPLFAVKPHTDMGQLADLLRTCHANKLEAGVWPLLRDDQGYWPSERNSAVYFERVTQILDDLSAQDISPPWLAVDLEPPLQQVDRLRHDLRRPASLVRMLRKNLDAARFDESVRAYSAHIASVRERGPRTLAVTLPMAAHDLHDGRPLWQDLLEAPWSPLPWDRAGVMAYGSMVAGYSRGWLSHEDARALHYRLFVRTRRHFGPVRAHASLGITGTGKLGDEPVYQDWRELSLDVSAAMAAGIEDVGIFCLEGLVGREDTGAWVDGITSAVALEPGMTPRMVPLRFAARAARALLARFS